MNCKKLIITCLFILSLLVYSNIYADTWYAEAKCNVNVQPGYPDHLGETTLWGKGKGKTEQEACKKAKKDAASTAPRGTQAKHCECFDTFKQKYLGQISLCTNIVK